VPITYTSNEQVEVYRFSAPTAIMIPLLAVFLQAFVPLKFHFFSIFDLPLLVVIFFAVARRSQVSGMLTGAAIGLLQDALTPSLPIGVYGIANTVVGYGASSLGVKLDVENAGSRLLVTLFFYVVHEIVYFTVARGMVGLTLHWSWLHELGSALANALLAVALFALLDRFKQRT
jgi:rod shape-determining protein MreD